MTQKMSQKEKILDLFQRRGSVTNIELNEICFRFSARIFQLRKEGHFIKRDHVKKSVHQYTYLGGPSSEPGAVEPLNGAQLGLLDNRPFDD
tara:strand:+ start:3794 stop:4066 length:273 start_codon:yes stop_codon:yes gene_type:complete